MANILYCTVILCAILPRKTVLREIFRKLEKAPRLQFGEAGGVQPLLSTIDVSRWPANGRAPRGGSLQAHIPQDLRQSKRLSTTWALTWKAGKDSHSQGCRTRCGETEASEVSVCLTRSWKRSAHPIHKPGHLLLWPRTGWQDRPKAVGQTHRAANVAGPLLTWFLMVFISTRGQHASRRTFPPPPLPNPSVLGNSDLLESSECR